MLGEADIVIENRLIGSQPVRLAAPDLAFKVTALQAGGWQAFEEHARRFLAHSSLEEIQWINITRGNVLFKTFRRKDG